MTLYGVATNKNKKYPEPSLYCGITATIPEKYINSGIAYRNIFYYDNEKSALAKFDDIWKEYKKQ